MSIRKHNEFLEGDESDELSDRGYDSEALEESRGILTGRAAKRQRPEDVSDEASFDGLRDDGVDEDEATAETRQPPVEHDGETDQEGEAEDEPVAQRRPAKTLLRPSTPKDVAAAEKAARKSGVVYISRVPPFMKPSVSFDSNMTYQKASHTSKHLLDSKALSRPSRSERTRPTFSDTRRSSITHAAHKERRQQEEGLHRWMDRVCVEARGANRSRDAERQHHRREEGQLLPRRSMEHEVPKGLQMESSH